MYCYKCGKEIPDNSVYCQYCGAIIKANENNKSAKLKLIAGVVAGFIIAIFGVFKGYEYGRNIEILIR